MNSTPGGVFYAKFVVPVYHGAGGQHSWKSRLKILMLTIILKTIIAHSTEWVYTVTLHQYKGNSSFLVVHDKEKLFFLLLSNYPYYIDKI